ncbi:hypothetical protein ABK040_005437 [Willaertia magna]
MSSNQSSSDQPKLKKPVKSVIPKLQNCAVNLSLFRKVAAEELRELIEKVKTTNPHKAFVFDPELIGPLSLIVPYSFFIPKGSGSSEPEIGTLKQEKIAFKQNVGSIFYITRPRIELIKIMAAQISNIVSQQPVPNIYVIFVPRRTLIAEVLLEKMNILQHVQKPLMEFSLDFIPFDNDLLSMEYPYGFRECELEGDFSSLYSVARSIMKLQSVYGLIPNTKYIGKSAKMTFEILREMRQKTESEINQVNPNIGNLIIFDRKVDLVTPLMTPLTYEGLVDSFYRIQNNLVTIPFLTVQKKEDEKEGNTEQKDQNEEQSTKKVPTRLPLNDDDDVYKQIRHLNILSVGSKLSSIAIEIDKTYEERKNLNAIEDIKAYFHQLPDVQQKHKDLSTHITIATELKKETSKQEFRRRIRTEQDIILGNEPKICIEYIESCIIRQDPLPSVLRLVCLYSIVRNGLTQTEYDHLREELVYSYGHFVVLTLKNLEEAGVLRKSTSKLNWSSPFTTLRKSLSLFVEDLDEQSQKNMAYVHSGYAPLSCRLIQDALNPTKWDQLKSLFKGTEHYEYIGDEVIPNQLSSDVTLIYFIGGCTFSEISALRSLQVQNPRLRFIIATTKLINTDSFLSSVFEKI